MIPWQSRFFRQALSKIIAWSLCLAGAALVVFRFAAFARLFPGLNLPKPLLLAGAAILAFNIAVPLIFRAGLDNDSKLANELWAPRAIYCWYLALPLLALLGHIIPKPATTDSPARSHQQPWIPATIYLLWLAATATHLGTIGYVDDQLFSLKLILPLLWAASWLLTHRAQSFHPALQLRAYPQLLLLPAILPAPALLLEDAKMLVALTALNTAILTARFLLLRQAFALKLAAATAAAAYLCLPQTWFPQFPLDITKWKLALGFVLTAGFLASLYIRNARGGILGAASLSVAITGLADPHPWAGHLAWQTAMIFHLLHSLRWQTPLERGSAGTLFAAAFLWLADIFMLRHEAIPSVQLLPTGAALAFILGVLALERKLTPRVIRFFILAAIVALLNPILQAAEWIAEAPAGAVALAASFTLFALGTLHALRGPQLITRLHSHFNRRENQLDHHLPTTMD